MLTTLEEQTWKLFVSRSQDILRKLDERFKTHGLKPLAWYDVLLELHKSPDGSLRCQEINERILLSKSNLSRLLDRLEAEALVFRQESKEDGRCVSVAITQEGKELLEKMWPLYGQSIHELFSAHLTITELHTFKQLLGKLAGTPGSSREQISKSCKK